MAQRAISGGRGMQERAALSAKRRGQGVSSMGSRVKKQVG